MEVEGEEKVGASVSKSESGEERELEDACKVENFRVPFKSWGVVFFGSIDFTLL